MAITSVPELIGQLITSLQSASAIGPSVYKLEHNSHGISLLDSKNEILLSYLQHLVFLILIKSRTARMARKSGQSIVLAGPVHAAIVNKLVELRLYLEKGVRPLEEKLKYQIDKVLRSASNSDANATAINGPSTLPTTDNLDASDISSSGDDDQEQDYDDSEVGSGADKPNSVLAPRISAFIRKTRSEQRDAKSKKGSSAAEPSKSTEVYKVSKTRRILMPEDDKRPRADRSRTHRSHTMDEYLQDEFSSAPLVMPSIGTNIRNYGRSIKTEVERKKEEERREWEETNYKRLPDESKKQKRERMMANGRSGRMTFGGEEFRELGDGAERVSRMTKHKGGFGTKALLERSRKRTHDGSGWGVEMGERFQKRLRTVERGRRDR